MNKVSIQTTSKHYDVYIEAGLRFEIGQYTKQVLRDPASSVFIISDSVVAPLYLKDVKNSFGSDIPVYSEVIPSGEASKSFQNYDYLLTKALENRLDRKSVIIALGGGVVGDIAGFVAATYMRGIRFIQVPTTLLAHDSSVGGKVAINHPLGKNMIGSFHQPEAVFYDTETLFSLPEEEWRSGFAEVIKHGFIRDRVFLKWLEETMKSFSTITTEQLNDLLERSIAVKANIVAEDERETGVRAYLNFGHTLGHAIESELGYGVMTHGEAVAIGMLFALRLSERTFNVNLEVEKYEAWFKELGYKTHIPAAISVKQLVEKMQMDKKAELGQIRMILLRELEDVVMKEMSIAEIEEVIVERTEVSHG